MKLLRPVHPMYKVSAPFGHVNPNLRDGKPHKGTDFACPTGTPVRACYEGVVMLVRDLNEGTEKQKRAGNRIGLYSIGISPAYRALYFHLHSFMCKLGQHVKRGDLVALSGNTGYSTGPHLHFELRLLNTDESVPPEDFEVDFYETGTAS